MSAILNPNVIVDSLVPTVDGLRAALYPLAGVRQFNVGLVTRVWSGMRIGEGARVDAVVSLNTQSRVDAWELKYEQQPCGLVEVGSVHLSEVSLSYSFADLTGGAFQPNQQFFVTLQEAHGQLQPTRYFVHERPPLDDREQGIGWKLWLKRVNVPDGAA